MIWKIVEGRKMERMDYEEDGGNEKMKGWIMRKIVESNKMEKIDD